MSVKRYYCALHGAQIGDTVAVVRAADYDALAARLAEAERDADRWRRVRRLSRAIRDDSLRGTVCSFLDRFSEPVETCEAQK